MEICHISLQKEQCKHSECNDQQITKVDFALQTLQNTDTKNNVIIKLMSQQVKQNLKKNANFVQCYTI